MAFSRRRFGLLVTAPAISAPAGSPAPARPDVADALRRAATFLDERLSYRGGYVWSYLPDLSRTWGEMAAAWKAAHGIRRPTVHLPLPGALAAAFRAGKTTLRTGGERGTIRWEDWLRDSAAAVR